MNVATEALPPSRPGRLPMRATGLLAIAGTMVLAMLLVSAALLFRSSVKQDLLGMEQAHARETALVRKALAEPASAGPLARELQAAADERARHLAAARRSLDGGTVAIVCLAWLGITCAGTLALLFFSRLTSDIGALRWRALAILVGERRPGGPLGRNDELGDLAQSLDELALALRERERELAIERRHVLHQEKLAAIGSIAAGVLRDIGNPIAAIDGHARAIQELGAVPGEAPPCDVAPILHETARLAAITHRISELAAAPARQCQLTSLNEVVTQSIGLLRYEPRLENVEVAPRLDPQLPAVPAIADRLVLLVSNLASNAADAMATLPLRSGRLEVSTRPVDGGVELCVADNGRGMTEAIRRRAFQPLFTTKPAGQGGGLGLTLCRTIAEEHGGRITIESSPGDGTRVRVWLPLEHAEAPPLHAPGAARSTPASPVATNC